MPIAFTRAVSPRLAECETTQAGRVDVKRAVAQHAAYEAALAAAGFEVRRLASRDDFPDGVFVEDTALLLGAHAVILRPGAASRAGETESVAAGLAGQMDAPSFGERPCRWRRRAPHRADALCGHLHAHRSGRHPRAGRAGRAARLCGGAGPVVGGLHLKSAATCVSGVLVHNPAWVAPHHFAGAEPLAVAPGEDLGGNVLLAGETLLTAADSPRTAETLAARGFNVVSLDISEMRKADAALTCMSLISEAA